MRNPRRSPLRAGALALLIAGSACEGARAPERAARDDDGPSLSYIRSFDVEENKRVVNVTPRVGADPRGGFLVADGRESQIRRYSPSGKLLWFAGRRGGGPGEYQDLVGVARLLSGDIVAVNRHGRLTFLDAEGRTVRSTVETHLEHVLELEVVDDSTLLLSGVDQRGLNGPRLHLWSIPRGSMRSSFFAPFANQRNVAAATSVGYTKAALRGDTVAATFASSDTVYLFTLAGRAIGTVPLRSEHFRRVPAQGPGRTVTDPREATRWVSRFDMVADVEWLSDGGLLVAYQGVDAADPTRRHWHLVGQDRSGRRRFEHRDVPAVLGASADGSFLILVAEGAEAPNRWSLARLPE